MCQKIRCAAEICLIKKETDSKLNTRVMSTTFAQTDVGRSFIGIHKTTQGRMNNWTTDRIAKDRTNNRIEGKTRNRIRGKTKGKIRDKIKDKIRSRTRIRIKEIAIGNGSP